MKAGDEIYCVKYNEHKYFGIKDVYMINEAYWVPYLVIEHINGDLHRYKLSSELKQDIIWNTKIIDIMINNHIKNYRKKKLEKLNEVQTQS